MEIEDRLKAIEDELPGVKGELRRILLDIRAFVMEAYSPIGVDSSRGKSRSQILQEKKVEENGDREESRGPRRRIQVD
jgi:hypothetical protein